MYAQIAALGMSLLGSRNQFIINRATQRAEKTVSEAQIGTTNMLNEVTANVTNALRGENNTLLAARAALSNFQRSAGNKAMLDTAGDAKNAASTNIARIAERRTGDSLERRIQAAEQQGAATAAFAASGTGGATQRMLKQTMLTSTSRQEGRIKDAERQQSYDMLLQEAGIMSGVIPGLDQGQTFAAVDHTVVTPQRVISPMYKADIGPTWGQTAAGVIGQHLGGAIKAGALDNLGALFNLGGTKITASSGSDAPLFSYDSTFGASSFSFS